MAVLQIDTNQAPLSAAEISLIAKKIEQLQFKQNKEPSLVIEGPVYVNGQFQAAYFHGQYFATEAEWNSFCELAELHSLEKEKELESVAANNAAIDEQAKLAELSREQDKANSNTANSTKRHTTLYGGPYVFAISLSFPGANLFKSLYENWKKKATRNQTAEAEDETSQDDKATIFQLVFQTQQELKTFADLLTENSFDVLLCNLPNLFLGVYNGALYTDEENYFNALPTELRFSDGFQRFGLLRPSVELHNTTADDPTVHFTQHISP